MSSTYHLPSKYVPSPSTMIYLAPSPISRARRHEMVHDPPRYLDCRYDHDHVYDYDYDYDYAQRSMYLVR